jgi:hypothetical protein
MLFQYFMKIYYLNLSKVYGFKLFIVRATLDESLRSKVQWNRAILLVESHTLDPQPLDEGPRPKSGKESLNLHDTILEEKSIGYKTQKRAHRRAHHLKNQVAS